MNSNPVLTSAFKEGGYSAGRPMTVSGVMNKLGLMTVLMMLSGGAVWYNFAIGNFDKVQLLTWAGVIVGFIAVLFASFARKTSPIAVPIYAFAQGAYLAGISCFIEARIPGIVIRAVGLTFLTVFAMYFLYAARVIKVTDKLKSTIITMTFAVAIFYLIAFVLSFFGINIPMLYDASPLGIGFSLFMTGLAAFNLLIDFDFIETASKYMFPKEYEWTGALGLLVTIVWLYVEILRLLARFQDRN